MARPYTKNYIKPFKLNTSIPIGPQLVKYDIEIDGDDNNYILDDMRIAAQNKIHPCGCKIEVRQICRARNGRMCKCTDPAVKTILCTRCKEITILG